MDFGSGDKLGDLGNTRLVALEVIQVRQAGFNDAHGQFTASWLD
jgi:hypothetical protein